MEAIKSIEVQKPNFNIVIFSNTSLKFIIVRNPRKLWIYQTPQSCPQGKNKSLVWMAMGRRAKEHVATLESFEQNG
jgi:hypothetical protein